MREVMRLIHGSVSPNLGNSSQNSTAENTEKLNAETSSRAISVNSDSGTAMQSLREERR